MSIPQKIDYLRFYVPLKNINSLIWRRHHCRSSKEDLSIDIKICDLDLGIFFVLIFEWSAVELWYCIWIFCLWQDISVDCCLCSDNLLLCWILEASVFHKNIVFIFIISCTHLPSFVWLQICLGVPGDMMCCFHLLNLVKECILLC